MKKDNIRTQKRRHAYRLGIWAEWAAILWLSLKGYYILARRYKTPHGEIDLIACRRDTLVAIEVKARARSFTAEVITPHQQQRITRGLALFLAKHPKFAHYTIRFDALCLSLTGWPRHIHNAWGH